MFLALVMRANPALQMSLPDRVSGAALTPLRGRRRSPHNHAGILATWNSRRVPHPQSPPRLRP